MSERHEALRAEMNYARAQTDLLFNLISPEALYRRPVPDRHRLIFYKGHFEAFDWNLLARRSMNELAFHGTFDTLFERGIDPAPGEGPADKASDWPSPDEIDGYRTKTRKWIDGHFDDLDPVLVQMAIEHRHMHAETFAYLLHNLPYDDKVPAAASKLTPRPAPVNPMVQVDSGTVTLGKTAGGFGWDNEYLAHNVSVPAFGISKYKTSNGEYLAFVNEGGEAPHFWSSEGGQWFYRGMFERMPLPLDWPVWVTWQQASAYAAWRGMRLPTEAQYQLAAEGSDAPNAARDNFGFNGWDPVAVDSANGGVRPVQMVGNGWEWTRDPFAPFAGFEPHPYYPGYSADFFDGQHYVLKGASPRTAKLLTRPAFRNWFRPEYPYMYAGFRVVESR